MRDEFLKFGAPKIEQSEIDEVTDTLRSGWLSTGPKVSKFEDMFRAYKGAKYALAVNSCTSALHLSLIAIGIKPGDEVIVPTMTFAATANSVIHAGGKPVFVDCEKDTLNMCVHDVEKKITPRTRAIIPVHFAGRPCPMDEIRMLAKKHKLKIIEDCAHAIESEYHGEKVGAMGDLGCFSFYVTKNLATGEGGMVLTNNEEYAKRAKMMSLHGMTKDAWKRFGDEGFKHYQIEEAGYKYNMMDIQAALGIHQLARIEQAWKHREKIWKTYDQALKDFDVFLPSPAEQNTKHAYHLYTACLDIDRLGATRDDFLNHMTKQKIGVGVHYIALHLHPYYQRTFGCQRGQFPNAEWISDRTVSLPLSAAMDEKDIKGSLEAMTDFFNAHRANFSVGRKK